MNHTGNCHVEPISRQPQPVELEALTDTVLFISGMGCPNCAMRVHNALVGVSGVIEAHVDHLANRALVRHNPELVPAEDLLPLVAAAGDDGRHRYRATLSLEASSA